MTGATGTMGFAAMRELIKDLSEIELTVLAQPGARDRAKLKPYTGMLDIVWGDLNDRDAVRRCVKGADLVLHVGALVSPAADYNPQLAVKTNWGGTVTIIRAIRELSQENRTALVYIGTVAGTGDRMPPIHWGRVGDPLKPSVFDYYALSKNAAERAVIESGLARWVSLRQTGIIGPAMASTRDAIIFHNGLDNVLEYVSDRDSARLLRNLCTLEREGKSGGSFWNHVFNIGGGPDCRIDGWRLLKRSFAELGIGLEEVFESDWFATRNFHGHYYLDSDRLEDILHFRSDSIGYFFECFRKSIGPAGLITRLPPARRVLAKALRRQFEKLALGEHGTLRFVRDNMEGHIAACWGSRRARESIPPFSASRRFQDWDTVVPIDHGYDETLPEEQLGLADVRGAALFRGGECLSSDMEKGNWRAPLRFRCAFGHEFSASPRLVLEGGHWCPICENESWNYGERALRDPFFAQVWRPLHPADEKVWTYEKSARIPD